MFNLDRRQWIAATAAGCFGAAGLPSPAAAATPTAIDSETLVRQLHRTLSSAQRQKICFDWDHQDPKRGLLRTHVANNWNITPQTILSEFYNDDQRDLIRAILDSMISPDWRDRYQTQMEDDAGGFGHEQSIAIFGNPAGDAAGNPAGGDKFELVLTGRHMTLRCDGNSAEHVAFGGPIFYGHAPEFNESADHPGNVFWDQAIAANGLYEMLDGKQRKASLIDQTPKEQRVGFGQYRPAAGLAVADLSGDQKRHMQSVLSKLIEPFRTRDQDEVKQCLADQGGLDACRIMYFADSDIGNDGVWDNWRLEGPSFVWHFRGKPHVHVWVNVADHSGVELNA